MSGRMKSAACAASALTLTLLLSAWAASTIRGAAHFRAVGSLSEDRTGLLSASARTSTQATRGTTIPSPVTFRESGDRGLLVRTWVNGAGPFTFAVDTGAGATITDCGAIDQTGTVDPVGWPASSSTGSLYQRVVNGPRARLSASVTRMSHFTDRDMVNLHRHRVMRGWNGQPMHSYSP